MCNHPKKKKTLLERTDDTLRTKSGEQLVRCRICGDVDRRHVVSAATRRAR